MNADEKQADFGPVPLAYGMHLVVTPFPRCCYPPQQRVLPAHRQGATVWATKEVAVSLGRAPIPAS
jgi:hypothetical protein